MRHTQHSAARNFPLCRAVTFNHLVEVLPPSLIADALAQTGVAPARVRRLDLLCTYFLVIAMHLFGRMRLGEVLATLCHTARLARPGYEPVAGDAAITYRRQQLGVRPLVALCRQLCRPLATPTTPGAFLGPWRLMAIDGTVFDVPDTAQNRRVFGGPSNQHGHSAYPQLRAVALVECGTHAIVDVGCWPYRTSEYTGLTRLLRSVTPDMLILLDRGLHSAAWIAACRARGAHVLARLPSNVRVRKLRRLPDGSWLAELPPQDRGGQRQRAPLPVRYIEYTSDDPQAAGTVYRLITTLLDHDAYPAPQLAALYHERWEVETTFDELKTHLDLADHPFRSKTPLGVVQEFYGLVLAHYVVRGLMHASAVEGQVDPDRLSFVRAVRVLERYLPDCQRAAPEDLPRLAARIRAEMRERLLPPRQQRTNPRVVKRRGSTFPTKPHATTPARLRRPIPELIRLI